MRLCEHQYHELPKPLFRYAWPKLRELNADIVDEHCYAKPDWFFNNTHRYDNYDRKGPKVFFGEYAAQSDKIVSVLNRSNLECAISEAAFMTGLERYAEVVRMASYAMDSKPNLDGQSPELRRAELLCGETLRQSPGRRRVTSEIGFWRWQKTVCLGGP